MIYQLNQAGYYGITTAESVSRPLIELSQKTNCQVSDLLYIEDNQVNAFKVL